MMTDTCEVLDISLVKPPTDNKPEIRLQESVRIILPPPPEFADREGPNAECCPSGLDAGISKTGPITGDSCEGSVERDALLEHVIASSHGDIVTNNNDGSDSTGESDNDVLLQSIVASQQRASDYSEGFLQSEESSLKDGLAPIKCEDVPSEVEYLVTSKLKEDANDELVGKIIATEKECCTNVEYINEGENMPAELGNHDQTNSENDCKDTLIEEIIVSSNDHCAPFEEINEVEDMIPGGEGCDEFRRKEREQDEFMVKLSATQEECLNLAYTSDDEVLSGIESCDHSESKMEDGLREQILTFDTGEDTSDCVNVEYVNEGEDSPPGNELHDQIDPKEHAKDNLIDGTDASTKEDCVSVENVEETEQMPPKSKYEDESILKKHDTDETMEQTVASQEEDCMDVTHTSDYFNVENICGGDDMPSEVECVIIENINDSEDVPAEAECCDESYRDDNTKNHLLEQITATQEECIMDKNACYANQSESEDHFKDEIMEQSVASVNRDGVHFENINDCENMPPKAECCNESHEEDTTKAQLMEQINSTQEECTLLQNVSDANQSISREQDEDGIMEQNVTSENKDFTDFENTNACEDAPPNAEFCDESNGKERTEDQLPGQINSTQGDCIALEKTSDVNQSESEECAEDDVTEKIIASRQEDCVDDVNTSDAEQTLLGVTRCDESKEHDMKDELTDQFFVSQKERCIDMNCGDTDGAALKASFSSDRLSDCSLHNEGAVITVEKHRFDSLPLQTRDQMMQDPLIRELKDLLGPNDPLLKDMAFMLTPAHQIPEELLRRTITDTEKTQCMAITGMEDAESHESDEFVYKFMNNIHGERKVEHQQNEDDILLDQQIQEFMNIPALTGKSSLDDIVNDECLMMDNREDSAVYPLNRERACDNQGSLPEGLDQTDSDQLRDVFTSTEKPKKHPKIRKFFKRIIKPFRIFKRCTRNTETD